MASNSSTLARTKGKVKSAPVLLSLIVLFSLVLAACGGGSSSTTASKWCIRQKDRRYVIE